MNCTINLSELIENVAEEALSYQRPDGSLPPGHNGPYHDQETPVRNTSHWLITFLTVYQRTGSEEFLEAAEDALSYLKSDSIRPHGATYHHRTSDEKDGCNGVIGQAWTIEALVTAAKILGDTESVEIAEEVFLLHPFVEDVGLWKQVEIDGRVIGFDPTFNHQLWFAAAGAMLADRLDEDSEVDSQVRRFLDNMGSTLHIEPSGLISHRSIPEFDISAAGKIALSEKRYFAYCTLEWANLHDNRFLDAFFESRFSPTRGATLSRDDLTHKSIGYHAFNLYALALLYDYYPGHNFWNTRALKRAISYLSSDEYLEGLEDNEFGFPYNPPGFEVPFVLETFRSGDTNELQSQWMDRQVELTYNPETNQFDRNNPDPSTLTARIYEATRLDDFELSSNLN